MDKTVAVFGYFGGAVAFVLILDAISDGKTALAVVMAAVAIVNLGAGTAIKTMNKKNNQR